MDTFRTFLNARRSDEDHPEWNVTGMSESDKGKYFIKDEDYDKFLELAYNFIFTSKKPKTQACSLLEKHRENGPLLIDLDFRYNPVGPLERRFSEDNLLDFIIEYVSAIARFVDISKLEEDLVFYVMNKPNAEHDGKQHKDGVHIQCSNITTDPKFQYAIRGYLLQKETIERIFGETELTNKAYDCFDASVIHKNNWFLYGACKPNKAQYKIQRVIKVPRKAFEDVSVDKIDEIVETELKDLDVPTDCLEIMKLLSIRVNHTEPTKLVFRPETLTEYNHLLTLWGKGNAKFVKPDIISHISSSMKAAGGAGAHHEEDDETVVSLIGETPGMFTHTHEDIKLAYRLVRECLDAEKRCGDYNDWISVGICLKNISNTSESLAVWSEITRKVDKSHKKSSYSDAQLMAKWNLLKLSEREKPLKMGSLHYWAKVDNLEVYNSILGESIIDWIINFADETHMSVVTLVKRLYQHEFRCSTAGKKGESEWFMFVGHSWVPLKKNVILRKRLGVEVLDYYYKAKQHLITLILKGSQTEREVHEKKEKLLSVIMKKLKDHSFRNGVMKECESEYYDEKFLERLNMNPRFVGCSNGVLELRHHETDDMSDIPKVLFRPGRPDDCISFQTGKVGELDPIPYVPFDPEHPNEYHKAIIDFYEKVYPNKELREYVLTLDASCLEGENKEQKFYFETGSGGNGKSMRQLLKQNTLGDYAKTISVVVFTRKRPDSSQHNADIVRLRGARYIYTGEPEINEKINAPLMKQWSGGDAVSARGMFQDQDELKIMGRIFLACNDLPTITSMDGGTWRRIRVIPHVAKFIGPGDPVPDIPAEHIHARDDSLTSKFKTHEMRVAYLGILVYYYENYYLKHGLTEPDCVKSASDTYKHENDVFAAFAEETFVKEIGAGPIKFTDIISRFDIWKRTMPGASLLKRAQIIERLKAISAKGSSDKEFYGLKFRDTDEE